MTPDLPTLGQQYIDFAVTEIPFGKDKPRSATTLSSFRRAVEGFVAAAQGRDLTRLPEDFIESAWMQTQQSVIDQPIQLRVRVGAVRKFTQWLQQSGVAVPAMRFPNISTPAPKKKEPVMSDVTQLADPALNENAVPSAQTQTYQPAMQTAVPPPPPAPRPAAPKQTRAAENPLGAMFPPSQGSWKLRVRRERETGEDPVFIGDFPLERVQLFGAVEPFLSREIGPKVVAQGITGDVTFIVSAVDSKGAEANRARMTVACSPQAATAPVAAAAVPVPVPVTQTSTRDELLDVLSVERRAREEMEARLSEKLQPVERIVPAKADSSEMDDLRRMVAGLAQSVSTLAERMNERREAPPPPAPVIQPQQPAFDPIALMKVAMELARPAPAAQVQPQQPLGLTDMLGVLAQTKQMFAPAQVNIDVSPLEERIDHIQKQLATEKKDDITEMVTKFKAMKELFSIVDPASSAPKSTTISSALGGLIEKVVNNPQPIAEAAERVLTAMASLKAGQTGTATPPTQLPPRKPSLPTPLLDASRALLAASGDAVVVAMHEWLTLLQRVPETQKVAARLTQLAEQRKSAEFAIVLRQVLGHFGFDVSADNALTLTTTVFAKLKQVDAEKQAEAPVSDEELAEAAEEDSDEEEDDEEQGQPDLTVRVGGAEQAQEDDEQEDDDEEGEKDSDEEESDSDDEEAEAQPEELEQQLEGAQPIEESIEPVTAAEVEEAQQPKRKRRSKKNAPPTSLGLKELPKQPDPEVVG